MSSAQPMAVAKEQASPVGGDHRVVLHGIDWKTYEKLLDAFGERRIPTTYDRGTLEIMAPTWNHEWWKGRFHNLIISIGAELEFDIQAGGSTTFEREDVQRGLEADDCYYIENEPLIRLRTEIDLRRDPPPDLALEIDVTNSSLNRLGVYAALRVPEIWRFDTVDLYVYHLRANGQYEQVAQSLHFPYLPLDLVIDFLTQSRGLSDTRLLDFSRAWVRAQVVPLWKAAGSPMPILAVPKKRKPRKKP